MEAKTGVKEQVQTLNFRQWVRLALCISPHSDQPVHLRRGFELVAGMGLFAADRCGRIRRANFGRTAHPGLLVERVNSFKVAEGVKPWDKVLAPLMAVSVGFPLVIVAGLDHRFRWSAELPLWLIIIGFTLDHTWIQLCLLGHGGEPLLFGGSAHPNRPRACGV